MKNENHSRIITNEHTTDKTKVGYIRVSTAEQHEDRQLEALKDLNLFRIYIEKISAKDTNRPLLKQMLDYVREGDTIYINDFSRLARNTKDLLEIAADLEQRDVKLISIKENLDTSTATGKMFLTMIGAINEFERNNLLDKQREGIAIARAKGLFKGRKPIAKPDKWNEVYSLYINRRITGAEAMRRLNLKRNTFYKFVKAEKENNIC